MSDQSSNDQNDQRIGTQSIGQSSTDEPTGPDENSAQTRQERDTPGGDDSPVSENDRQHDADTD